jgi:hypothetical protein
MKNLKYIIILIAFISQSCVQETHQKTVKFRVDMTSVPDKSKVGVRGIFNANSWNETAPLTDKNGDGIYEGTFSQKTAINAIEFKFVNNDDYELKGQNNRIINFEYKPETIVYEAIYNNPNGEQIVIKN